MRLSVLIVKLIFLFQFAAAQHFLYPETRRTTHTDVIHGTPVADPYRWLEDDRSEETAEWVNRQNSFTETYLKTIPFRDRVRERLAALWNYKRHSTPNLRAGWYYYYKNDGNENHDVLFRRHSVTGTEEMVLNPNTLSDDGTVSLKFFSVSHDGTLAAYGISRAGSDWTEVKVMDCASKREFPESITGVKFSTIAWYRDGFYYSRFDQAGDPESERGEDQFQKIYYHKAGTSQSEDQLIHQDPQNPRKTFSARVTDDERFLLISTARNSSGNELVVRRINGDPAQMQVASGFNHNWSLVNSENERFLFLTNQGAPKRKVVEMHFGSGKTKDIIPEREETLIGATRAGNKLIAHYMKNAASKLYIHSLSGAFEGEIELNGIYTVNSLNGDARDSILYFSVSGFTTPGTVFRYNLNTGVRELFYSPEIPGFSSDAYETHQIFYMGKDGTTIPMFLVGKRGSLTPGETRPVLLFGYGGFNISKTPEFLIERIPFLEKGGMLALPNIRGGGEFGKEWHKAGTGHQKQNVFDDFIAAAEYLIREKYTAPDKLAIGGRSNGGLLVGAVMTQRPELFKAALPAVGVMDMIRFHKFTIGWAWTGDYGSPDSVAGFNTLIKYSPYHNLKPGTAYPATLVTTADHDDRVVPGHSYKFISNLQYCQSGKNPVLIRIDKDSGHGSGKPVTKIIDEQSDIFSFLMYNLGMSY